MTPFSATTQRLRLNKQSVFKSDITEKRQCSERMGGDGGEERGAKEGVDKNGEKKNREMKCERGRDVERV